MTQAGVAGRTRRVGVLLDHIGRVVRIGSEEALAPLGLRPRQYVALTLLDLRCPTSQHDVAAVLHLDPANVVGLLNELEQAGYVLRRRDAEDRRRHIVEVTRAGRRVMERAEEALAAVDEQLLGALSPQERETFSGLLERVAGRPPEDACTAAVRPEEPC